jgi:hypothetical protein
MCEIFISHIHEDEKAANAINCLLRAKLNGGRTSKSGIEVFLSANQFQIRMGDDWLQKIHSALNSAKVVVALFSDAALSRPWVHFEAGGAWFAEKKLMPVCLGNLKPEGLPKPYSNIQGCNLHEISAPYYLYQSIYEALRPGGLCLPPWPSDDDEEQALRAALSRWELDVGTRPEVEE